MKALSIRQPYAWLICAGYKDVENRNWRTNFRGRIYVHSSKVAVELHDPHVKQFVVAALANQAKTNEIEAYISSTLEFSYGAIIGEVDIVDCVTTSDSPWFVGRYGFVLKKPVLYKEPILCRGSVGFFIQELRHCPQCGRLVEATTAEIRDSFGRLARMERRCRECGYVFEIVKGKKVKEY